MVLGGVCYFLRELGNIFFEVRKCSRMKSWVRLIKEIGRFGRWGWSGGWKLVRNFIKY